MTSLPSDHPSPWGKGEIAEFLDQLKARQPTSPSGASGRGRLVFALDATASREPTWDQACRIQGEMFEATTALCGLDLQLVFYRGYDECRASRWVCTAADLHRLMRSVSCAGGETQLERVLTHAIHETGKRRVSALVFVGDAMEENGDRLCRLAGDLGRLGVPIFLFHEGYDPKGSDPHGIDRNVAATFRQMASLSRGAYRAFDLSSTDRLKELLGAIAVYATGGHQALAAYGAKKGGEVLRLTAQLRA